MKLVFSICLALLSDLLHHLQIQNQVVSKLVFDKNAVLITEIEAQVSTRAFVLTPLTATVFLTTFVAKLISAEFCLSRRLPMLDVGMTPYLEKFGLKNGFSGF